MAPSTPAGETFTRLFEPSCVPFFLLLSLYFFLKKAGKLPAANLRELHPDRLMVPCFAWTLIYTLMRMLKYHARGQVLAFDFPGFLFYGGAALHLYFLPCLLLFQALALAALFLLRGGLRNLLLGLAFAAGACLFGSYGSAHGHFGFHSALQSGVVYVILAHLLDRSQTSPLGRRLNVLAGLAVVGLLIAFACRGAFPLSLGLLRAPLIGYGLSALALNWSFRFQNQSAARLLTCSYGIYLAHFAVIETFEFLAEQSGHPLAPYSFPLKLTMGLGVCAICLGLIALFRTHWLSAYLLLGEQRQD